MQGVGASVFIVIGALGSSVEEAYLALVDTTIIVYFIPYLYLFAALPVLRRRGVGGESAFRVPGGGAGLAYVAVAGLATTAVSIVLSTLPGDVAARPGLFVAKVIGGAMGLLAVGLVFYATARRKGAAARGSDPT